MMIMEMMIKMIIMTVKEKEMEIVEIVVIKEVIVN